LPLSDYSQMNEQELIQAGIDNLLDNCIQAKAGDSLTIVSERGKDGYYSKKLDSIIAAHARERSLKVDVVTTEVIDEVKSIPEDIQRALKLSDHTLFLARIGDQLRFTALDGKSTKTICYALDEQTFTTPYCSANYQFFLKLKALINKALFGEKHITLTCASGTHLVGTSPPDPGDDDVGDVHLRRFPMGVFRPIPANTFSGKVALSKWLCPTGSRYYEPEYILIDGVVMAVVERGRIVGFEGNESEVRKIETHYNTVAEKYGIEGDVIHSWHAGMHPQNGYQGLAVDNMARWAGAAFGNPRYLHMHTCGNYAPGEICVSVFDQSIAVDGVDLWRDGRLVFAETPEVQELVDEYPEMRALFEQPVMEYGLGDYLVSSL